VSHAPYLALLKINAESVFHREKTFLVKKGKKRHTNMAVNNSIGAEFV